MHIQTTQMHITNANAHTQYTLYTHTQTQGHRHKAIQQLRDREVDRKRDGDTEQTLKPSLSETYTT